MNILCLLISIAMIAGAVAAGVYLGVPLTLAFFLLVYCAIKNGRSRADVWGDIKLGLKKAFIVVKVLLLISICTALFLASGCTATLILYAMKLLTPGLFLVFCFLVSSGFSMLQGSAFATASTCGLVLYIIGCAGGVPPAMTAGAVLSGLYVGDRGSPVSSSLALSCSMTDVPHHEGAALMFKTALVPYLLTILFYLPLSLANPLSGTLATLTDAVNGSFRIGFAAVLPVVVLLMLCLFRVKVTWSLAACAVTGFFVALFYQNVDVPTLIPIMLNGFLLPEGHALAAIMKGGGLLPMIASMYVVAVSCALAVVLEEGGIIGRRIPAFLAASKKPFPLLLRMWAVSIPGAMLGCNQTMSLVLTGQLMKKPYALAGLPNSHFMADLTQTATLLSVLVPWTLAFSLPMSALGFTGIGCLPYAAFPLIGPVYHLLLSYLRRNQTAAAASEEEAAAENN